MSVNTAHANGGVLVHAGEYILLFSDNVTMDFSGQDGAVFKGTKHGRIYLTSHRMIFNNKKSSDPLQSFSSPFVAMSDVDLEQPVFGANYIKGKVRAQPNGNFIGEVKFKLYFNAGGAIEYGQAMMRAASMAQRNMREGSSFADNPPPYTPSGAWHEAPPPAYQPPPGYYGWLPTHAAFSGPPPNSVFMSDNPPPYPGIAGPPPYTGHQNYPNAPPQNYPGPGFQPASNYTPGVQPGYQPATNYQSSDSNQSNWYGGYTLPPEQLNQIIPHAAPSAPSTQQWGGYAGGQQAPPPYGQQQQQPGGFSYPNGGPQQQPNGYPSHGGGYPMGPQGGSNAMGFSAPPSNSKEAEAMRSAYENQSNQRPHEMPPPSYNNLPPSYSEYNRRQQ